MKGFFAATGLAAGASAAVVGRSHQCCFPLTASGGVSGPVGQLDDGQNRIGGNHPPGSYCIENGAITDGMGRGCILTPPTTQFQCDTGATPTGGFAVDNNGELTHNGDNVFYACPASDNMYNIYTMPVDNQPKCVEIMLSTGGKCVPQKPVTTTCPAPSTVYKEKTVTQTKTEMGKPETVHVTKTEEMSCPAPSTMTETAYMTKTEHMSCPAPSTMTETAYMTETEHMSCPAPSTAYVTKTEEMKCPAPSTMTETISDCSTYVPPPQTTTVAPPPKTTVAPPPQTTTQSPPQQSDCKCPTDLSGPYEYPHLIVPVSSEKPDYAYGTSYNGTIKAGSECSIFNFDVPQSLSGKTCQLEFLFPEQKDLTTSSYDISGSGDLTFTSLSSPANEHTTYNNIPSKMSEVGSIHSPMPGNSYCIATYSCPAGKTVSLEVCGTGNLMLEYFQDYNPSPIGLYIASC